MNRLIKYDPYIRKILLIGIVCFSFLLMSLTNLPDRPASRSGTEGRQAGLDSLLNVWTDSTEPDTSRLKLINSIAWGYLYSKPDSTYYFAQLAYDFAKSKGYKKQMANALNNQAASFYFQGNYDSAIVYLKRCLTINEEIGYSRGIASCLGAFGNIYSDQGKDDSSIDYYTRSLTMYEEIGDSSGIATALGNIGVIYSDQPNGWALDYYTRSLAIFEEIGDSWGISRTLGNIGINYANRDKYDSAIDYYSRSLTIKKEIGDKYGSAISLDNIGTVYQDQDKYDSAIEYHTRSLAIREEIGDKWGITLCLINIGRISSKQGNYANAITLSNRALTIAQEVGLVNQIRAAANLLYKTYKTTGRNKLALEMYELYIATRDSIESEENQKELIRQKYKYDYDKKAIADSVTYVQAQNIQEAKLEKSRILQFSLLGGVVLLVAFLLYVFNRFRVTRKQKLLISEQNEELTIATQKAESANSELQTKSKELEKFNTVMLDREMRIIELKKEINNKAKSNKMDVPYPEVEDD